MMKSHLSLYVSDIVRSSDFYTRFLGAEPVKTKADYAKFELEDPAFVLSLVQNPERASSGFGHAGIVVESKEAVIAWLTQAKERGVEIALVEDQTRCCYALQDKFWVHDPDGVQWEVYTFHENSEWNDPHFGSEQAQEKSNAVCCPQ
jgi:catechol 2,3-dioxygenase-like lactoylglutathione lyase family enzyme